MTLDNSVPDSNECPAKAPLLPEEENDLITEDESNFYSCAESQDGEASPLNNGRIINTQVSATSERSAAFILIIVLK